MIDDQNIETPGGNQTSESRSGAAQEDAAAQANHEQSMASLQAELEQERSRAQQYLANWQRAQADFVNYKRRVEQERQDAVKFANAMLILSLLSVLDDFERAMATVPTSLAGFTWFEGARLIQRKMLAVLQAQGLTEIPAEGRDFDPTIHDAVAHGPGEEGRVIEELQKGYRLHDRVIRPTLVRVGQGPASSQQDTVPE